MPAGMRLRSSKRSSHIADPRRALTIDRYVQVTGRSITTPALTREEFVDYGLWFAGQAVPDLDPRRIEGVCAAERGFDLRLSDGEQRHVDRLVVAAGLSCFPHWPEIFRGFSNAAVTHTCEHRDLSVFAHQRVAVVGSGQSALESAALLFEHGAEVEVIMRTQAVNWLPEPEPALPNARPSRFRSIPLPPTDIGGGGPRDAWVAATPDVWRLLDPARQQRISFRCVRPAASGWLRPRTAEVTITAGRLVSGLTERHDGRLRLRLDDGTERVVDHVLLGTGYAVDVRRYPFLDSALLTRLVVADGFPVLGAGLESSISGLHFLGAPATHSFGPIMRFVVGSWYAAPALTRQAIGGLRPPVRLSF